jgi:hypothetical protein
MKKTGSDNSSRGTEPAEGSQAEPIERARLQAEVARQRVRIAKEELKRARKRLKEAKREAKRARKLASSTRKIWKRARRKARKSEATDVVTQVRRMRGGSRRQTGRAASKSRQTAQS